MFHKPLPILIALIISLVCGGVHIYRAMLLIPPATYTPLVTVGVDIHTVDEVFYAQRIQRAASGDWLVGDRHFYEHRNDAYIFPTFTPLLFGLITRLLGDISWTFILADFIFPPISFLLLYYLLHKGTKNVLVSITGSIAAVFYDIFQVFIAAFLRLTPKYFIERMYIGDGRVLHITRFEAQEFIFPFILIAVLCLWQALQKKSLKFSIVSGIIFGLHPYIYPYSTLFYAMGTGLFLLYLMARKEWQKVKYALIALLVGFLVSLPYFFTFLQFKQLAVASEIFKRMSIVEYYSALQVTEKFGHYFIFLGFSFYLSRKNSTLRFVNFYLLGVILALGFFPYGKIYHLDIYLKIWFPVVLFMFFHEILTSIKKTKNAAFIQRIYTVGLLVIFLIILGGGSIKHLSSAIPSRGNFTINQSILESYEWIRKNTSHQSVILSPSLYTNREILAYIPNFVFLGRGEFTYASTQEIIERAFLTYKYFNYSESDIAFVFTGMDTNISIPFKAPYTQDTIETLGVYYFLGQSGAFPENVENTFGNRDGLHSLLEKYRQTPQLSLAQIQMKYRVDYLYFGPYEKKIIQVDPNLSPELEKVFTNNAVQIFRVNSN